MIKRAFQDITNVSSKNIKLTIHKSSHRKKLLRWLYEVCVDFKYSHYTYVTCLLIADHYTEKKGFDLQEYQLIGIASLLIAAKVEESKTKPLSEYSIVTDGAYNCQEIISMETEIIETLDYNIFFKLPHSHFNVNYFSANFTEYSLREKQDVLNCVLSALFERNGYTKNMFLLYLEAVREVEKILKGQEVDDDILFYISNRKLVDRNYSKA